MSAYGSVGTQQQQQQQQQQQHHHHTHAHAPIHHHHHRPQPSQQMILQQHQHQQQQHQHQHQHQHQQSTGVRYGRAAGSGRGIGLLANEQGMGNPGDEYLSLPSLDQTNSYTPIGTSYPPSGSSYDDLEQANPSASSGNRGNKLKKNSRWVRKGKAVAWGMSAGEREAEERLRSKLRYTLAHHLPPDSLRGRSPSRSLSPPLLPHLRSPSPPSVTSSHLSQLLSPPRSYTEIVLSPAMRYTFASGHLEDALGQTAGELIEGEIGLSRSLGRFFEECRERGIGKRDDEDEEDEEEEEKEKEKEQEVAGAVGETVTAPISTGPISTATAATEEVPGEANGANADVKSVIQDQDQDQVQIPEDQDRSRDPISTVDERKEYPGGLNGLSSVTSMGMDVDGPSASQSHLPSDLPSLSSAPHLSSRQPMDHSSIPSEGDPHGPEGIADGPTGLDQQQEVQLSALEKLFVTPEGVSYPTPQQGMDPNGGAMFLSVEMQKEALYRGMDALGELLADSREYVERLEEVRERLAGVGRARKRVWREIRERCLENGELGDGSTDS